MEKKRIEIVITIILALVLIFSALNALKVFKQKNKSTPQIATHKLEVVTNKVNVPEQAKEIVLANEWDSLTWVRDPHSGFVYTGSDRVVDLKLTGILTDSSGNKALLNDEIRGVGDTVGNYRIIKIYTRSVILSDGVQEIELKLE